jgi:hypothetical protein
MAVSGVGARLGRRGCALLFFAFLDLVYCHALLFPSASARRTPSLTFLASVVPLWGWALLWGSVGVVCLVFAFRRHDQPGFSAAIAVKVLWGAMYLGGWLFADLDRGYVSATIWLAFAAFVALLSGWPEPNGKGPLWTRPSS